MTDLPQPRRPALPVLTRAAAWACLLALVYLSLVPKDFQVRTGVRGSIEHLVAYAGTTLVVALAFPGRRVLAIGAAMVGLAGLLECGQLFSPGRNAQVEDWLMSSLGVLVGCLAGLPFRGFASRPIARGKAAQGR
jgi:VanZ family protein